MHSSKISFSFNVSEALVIFSVTCRVFCGDDLASEHDNRRICALPAPTLPVSTEKSDLKICKSERKSCSSKLQVAELSGHVNLVTLRFPHKGRTKRWVNVTM